MLRVSVISLFLALGCALPGVAYAQAESPRQVAISAMYPVMIKALETGNFGQARNICDQWIMWEPQNPNHHYNLACIEARAGGDRLQFAIPALQRAAELGFPEIGTLKNDPDLDPIRKDARFAEIERAVMRNAEAKERQLSAAKTEGPTQSNAVASPPLSPRAIENLALNAKIEAPAPPSFNQGVPVGLFFMTRFWSYTGTLEKLVWYFAPDGTAYQSLEYGFSIEELASHAGLKGTVSLKGDVLEVKWANGKKSSSHISRSDTGFSWDGGIFTPVEPFTPDTPIAGTYEGGESISFSGNRAAVSRTLELRPDGTFRWSGVSFLSSTSDASRVSTGAAGKDSTGRWHANSYSIVLVDAKGNIYRRIAFPYDDEKTELKPDRIFFGGTMFKRQ